MKQPKTVSLRSFERINKMLALAAVSAAIAPFYYTFLSRSVPLPWLFSIVFPPLLVYLGHGMQALFSRMAGIKPEGGTSAYEDLVKRFQAPQAAVPIMIELLIALMAIWGIDRAMQAYADAHLGVLYDPNSMMPFLSGIALCATMILGTVLWFYPYNRILSMRTILPWGIVFLLNFLCNLVFGGIPTFFLSVCLLVFAVLTLVLLNQGYVIRAIDKAGTGGVTSDVLKYNASLVFVLLVLFVLLFGAMMALMGGVTALARMGLYALREAALSSSGSDDRDWEEKSDDFVNTTFGEKEGGAFMLGQDAMAGMFLLFILFAVAFLGLFLLFRFRRQAWERFKAWIKRLIGDLLHFLRTALDLWNSALMDEEEEDETNDYVDTSVKMEKSTYIQSRPTTVPRNYRAVLATLKTAAEKNRYLYQLLLSRWGRFLTIQPSDTPDEILGKTSARLQSDHLPQITDSFVRFRYAGKHHEPSAEEADEVLDVMCEMLDEYERGDVQ